MKELEDEFEPPSYDRDTDEDVGRWTGAAQIAQGLYYFVAGIVGLVLLILIFVKGLMWYWDYAYPAVSLVAAIPVTLLFPTGLIMAIFRKTRGLSGLFLVICAFLYLGAVWAQSLAFAYAYAGKIWMLVGFFLAGVGVFFMAFVGGIIQGQYSDSFGIVISLIIFFAVYLFGSSLARNADKLERQHDS
jgi:MFS family permease